jgi:DNA-binding NtrC family response regulator
MDKTEPKDIYIHPKYVTENEVRRRFFLDILEMCGGNRTETAKWLGISLRHVRVRINLYRAEGYIIAPAVPGRDIRD